MTLSKSWGALPPVCVQKLGGGWGVGAGTPWAPPFVAYVKEMCIERKVLSKVHTSSTSWSASAHNHTLTQMFVDQKAAAPSPPSPQSFLHQTHITYRESRRILLLRGNSWRFRDYPGQPLQCAWTGSRPMGYPRWRVILTIFILEVIAIHFLGSRDFFQLSNQARG